MPTQLLTDNDVLAVLTEAARALTVNQILDALTHVEGQKGGVTRGTVFSHLQHLTENRQVVRLTLDDAADYGGMMFKRIPRTAFYICAQHRREWDARRLGEQLPIIIAADNIPAPAAGTALIAEIDTARTEVRAQVGELAESIRGRIAVLHEKTDAARPLRPEHAVAVRERLGWLMSLASDLEASADDGPRLLLARTPDTPASSPRPDPAPGGDAVHDELKVFQDAVWHAWRTLVPRDVADEHQLGAYTLASGFLDSITRQERAARMTIVRMIVRIVANWAIPETSRRPRAITTFRTRDGTEMSEAGLWCAQVSRIGGNELLLVWRVRDDEVIELLEVALPSQIDPTSPAT